MRKIVTLTTIPPRGLSVLETIKSIKQNTIKPDAIYVNLPNYLPRFQDQTFDPSLKSSLEDLGVIVNECEDFKTLTKFLPTLKNETEDDTLFIVIDDDGVYSPRFIEGLINGYKEFNCAVGYSGIAYPDYVIEKYGRIGYLLFQEHGQESHIMEASFGVAFKRGWISNLNIQPPNLYDDFIIGLYLDEIGIKKRVINYDYIGRRGDDWSSIVNFINQDENAISYGKSSIEKYYDAIHETKDYIKKVSLKTHTTFVKTTDGSNFNITVFDDDLYITERCDQHYEWEFWMRDIVKQVYRSGDILDIGGNIGTSSLMFSDFGPVHVFEPVPMFCNVIEKNINNNYTKHPINLHRYGLYSKDTTQKVYLPKSMDGKYNFGCSSMILDSCVNEDYYVECNFKKLDDVYDGNVSLIKIDTEGSELDILKGCYNTIKRCKPVVIFENHDKTKNMEFCNFFKQFGYSRIQNIVTESDFIVI